MLAAGWKICGCPRYWLLRVAQTPDPRGICAAAAGAETLRLVCESEEAPWGRAGRSGVNAGFGTTVVSSQGTAYWAKPGHPLCSADREAGSPPAHPLHQTLMDP